MRSRTIRPLALVLSGILGASLAAVLPAQETPPHRLAEVRRTLPADPDSARDALRTLLRQTIAAAERSEFSLAQNLSSQDRDSTSAAVSAHLLADVVDDRELLVALLDTVVLRTEWGPAELEQLRRRYPASPLFMRYEARLASQRGEHAIAHDILTRLLERRPTSAELHVERAHALEALGRDAEAVAALTRAFELSPGAPAIFRDLVRLRERNDTLPALLDQVRRLRRLEPEVPELVEQEIEVLHRLGRLDEAAAAAEAAKLPKKEGS